MVESVVRRNSTDSSNVSYFGNKIVRVSKGEKLGNTSLVNIRKQVKYIEMHPNKTHKRKINPNDINVTEEHRQK